MKPPPLDRPKLILLKVVISLSPHMKCKSRKHRPMESPTLWTSLEGFHNLHYVIKSKFWRCSRMTFHDFISEFLIHIMNISQSFLLNSQFKNRYDAISSLWSHWTHKSRTTIPQLHNLLNGWSLFHLNLHIINDILEQWLVHTPIVYGSCSAATWK